jgi:hypothetical protein
MRRVHHQSPGPNSYLARYDYECWDATFEDILKLVSKPGTVRCGQNLIFWLGYVYAEVAASERNYQLPMDRINRFTISMLRLEPRYLKTVTNKRVDHITSTPLCERKFGAQVRVSSRRSPAPDVGFQGVFEPWGGVDPFP